MACYEARWGIMACGGIASKFVTDLLEDPAKRNVDDVRHTVVAVASSSSVDKAKRFAEENKCARETKTYGSYEELVRDKDVEIVYIASPHAQHYENTLLALRARKHVLCEKPFTINAKQTKHLIEVAKENKVFLMEAMWTRFFPLVVELQKKLHQERVIGPLKRVLSDFGTSFAFDAQHRLYNPALGGGALLDLGIYPLTWLMITLFDDPSNERRMPAQIGSTILRAKTGVDAQTTACLVFDHLGATGTLTTTLEAERVTETHHTIIQGELGSIAVHGTPFRPESFRIHMNDDKSPPKVFEFPIPGTGMFWEADACARNLRDGVAEEKRCTWEDSIATMTILDTIRRQNQFSYPDSIEATE